MSDRYYELIEHTADIGIRVKGKDLNELFSNAAYAMFDIIAERTKESSSPKIRKFHIIQEAQNTEELFVNWLNELLSLSSAKDAIFCDFIFNKLDEDYLDVEASGCDIKGYKVNVEIKAATYHELAVRKLKSHWLAEVIFDV
ncbi:MAG: archease [Candidatus Omnitrophica bacterium]|nr:archease [Candidatus Omnitrophota bacterium]